MNYFGAPDFEVAFPEFEASFAWSAALFVHFHSYFEKECFGSVGVDLEDLLATTFERSSVLFVEDQSVAAFEWRLGFAADFES